MTYYDTARAYTDSGENADWPSQTGVTKVTIATKTGGKTGKEVREHLDTSLRMLKTDHIDLYQLHMVGQCYKPGDGTGVYEALEEAKREGKILHIGVTAHLIEVVGTV